MISNTLFLDCDGVLADFNALATTILGMPPPQFETQYGSAEFWARLNAYPDFYYALPLMGDALELFRAVAHLDPVILTGCKQGALSAQQKRRWVRHYIGNIPVIVTHGARRKVEHLRQPGDVLIDDRAHYRHLWEAAGGVFIHHVNAHTSLAALRELRPDWFQSGEDATHA